MNVQLRNYDVYPKMVKENNTSKITIKPFGDHAAFKNTRYTVHVMPMCESDRLMASPKTRMYEIDINDEGALIVEHHFGDEQEYEIRIFDLDVNYKDKDLAKLIFSVYALAQDLYELRPYKGDLHMHSYRSDGSETPALVASYYRKAGFDFIAITDHRKYSASIEAINTYKDIPIDLKIIPGEEVHSPDNGVHIVNFGGNESVTDIINNDLDSFRAQVDEIMADLDVDEDINKFAFASCIWVFDKIKEIDGLGIYAHPYWLYDVYNVPDKFTRELFKKKVFEVFELINGVAKMPASEKQIALYNEMKALGYDVSIVGSSDSHGCLEYHSGISFNKAKTIVFAKSCDKKDLFTAIRSKYSVAVDSYTNNDYRVHGSYRLTQYTRFLMDNYFYMHDELCFEEGLQMKRYCLGMKDSIEHLTLLKGRTKMYLEHLFNG